MVKKHVNAVMRSYINLYALEATNRFHFQIKHSNSFDLKNYGKSFHLRKA
jgi:hypothetical protein